MASIPTQEEFLAATRKSQEAMIAAIKTWFETVRTATPKLTSVYAPLSGRLPRLPVSLPFAGKLPTPEEAVGNAYHMAEQLLANQRQFAEELLKAMAPLVPGRSEAAPEGNGSSEPKVPSHRVWQEAVKPSEPRPVAIVRPKPVAIVQPKPVAVSEPKPVAVSEPKPVAIASPSRSRSASRSRPRSASPSRPRSASPSRPPPPSPRRPSARRPRARPHARHRGPRPPLPRARPPGRRPPGAPQPRAPQPRAPQPRARRGRRPPARRRRIRTPAETPPAWPSGRRGRAG